MPDIQDAITFLKKMGGVLHVFEMTDDMSMKVHDIEHAVTSPTGVEVRNDAYDKVMEFDRRVCIVYDDNTYTHIRRSAVIEMRTFDGQLVGTEIPPDQIEKYKERDDLLWVSDNFVMFMNMASAGPVRFVMPPMRFFELDEENGFADAIWASPSPPSSAILKESCGFGDRPKTSTMVIGLNLR